MNQIRRISRRQFMSFSLTAGGLYLLSPKLSLAQEECLYHEDILGPFFREGAPFRDVIGDSLFVYGHVRSLGCEPVPGALIDIWQANPEGEYDNKSPEFRYRARLYSEKDGSYRFYTDMPGLYEQRPIRHIHYQVIAKGYNTLVTQQYFSDEGEETKAEFDLILIPKS